MLLHKRDNIPTTADYRGCLVTQSTILLRRKKIIYFLVFVKAYRFHSVFSGYTMEVNEFV